MFIDTHSHLNFKAFDNDYDAAINRAINAGISKIIIVGSNLETSKKALEIAKKHPKVYAAIGLHPIHVLDENFNKDFEKLAENKKVVAIGETGLDYYYTKETKEKQKELFLNHLRLAHKLQKPIILHNRDAGEDILSLITSQSPMPKAVMHCFSENWDYAQVLLEMGILISFTGIITFTKNYDNLKVVENIPLDKLMIETDCPYLTPEPYRGQRNEPAYVVEIAKKIAAIKKIDISKVEKQTTKTAEEFFKI